MKEVVTFAIGRNKQIVGAMTSYIACILNSSQERIIVVFPVLGTAERR